MITSWDIYWITRLDQIQSIFVFLYLLFIAAGIIGAIATCDNELWREECWPLVKKIWLSAIAGFFLLIVVSFLTPDTKEAVAIYMVPKIVNNQQVQKLPDNAMKFLNGKLEEWIGDMAGKEKKK